MARSLPLSRPSESSLALAAAYGLVHAAVDASTVGTVFRATSYHDGPALHAFAMVAGYDVLAFGTQVLFGWWIDRKNVARHAIGAGLGCTTLGLLLFPWFPLTSTLLAAWGNALFHVGAGACVLVQSQGRAAPAGVFVAPGAFGLATGMWLGTDGMSVPMWPLLLGMAIGFAVLLGFPHPPAPASLPELANVSESKREAFPIMGLLLISIAVRSFIGLGAAQTCPKSNTIRLALPLVAVLGKGLGGFVADRAGWMETSVVALVASAPFLALGSLEPALAVIGLLVFQMTMPVTLVAAARAMPGRPATAFGWTCFALVAGGFPTFFPATRAVYGPVLFVFLILVSAGSVALALKKLGLGWGRQGFPAPQKAS